MNLDVRAQINKLLTDATDEENIGNRSDLLDRYLAEKYGDEVEGRSQFVSSDVADAVEAILPDVMDIFTSQETLAEFAPVGPEDVEAARQETKAVHHYFWEKNPGFEILYVWIKEALIQQNAYVWRGWQEKERVSIEEYEGLTLDELVGLYGSLEGEWEFVEQSGFEIVEDAETGAEMVVPDGAPINVKIRSVLKSKEYLIEPFPQEDFFCTPRWSRLGLEGVPCCGRRHRDKTKEDLKALGFSESSIEMLSSANDEDENSDARHHTQDLDESQENAEYLEVYECYMQLDLNGDGKNELVQVWCNEDGSTVMEWESGGEAIEEVSQIPISALTPYIMPHRHIGRSVTEQVDDIQKVNTVLLRQMLDNIYLTNYPRPIVGEDAEGDHTMDDLANPNPGAPIRVRDPGGLVWTAPQPVWQTTLPMVEKFEGLQEKRVGATRYNQGLDANSLNKTASGMAQIMNASQKKAKLVARTIAETGLRDLFLGIHRDLRAGPVKELMLRMQGQWIPVDPRTWRWRTDMVIRVGTGRGDREEKRAFLQMMAMYQEKLATSGSRLVTEQELFNTAEEMAATFGMGDVAKYIQNPQEIGPPPPPQPDPMQQLTVAQMQAQLQAMQGQMELAVAQFQAQERERERQFQRQMEELRLKFIAEERQQAKAASDIQTDEEKQELAERKAAMDDDFKRDKLEVDALTGFQRDAMKSVKSEPPVSYDEVMD